MLACLSVYADISTVLQIIIHYLFGVILLKINSTSSNMFYSCILLIVLFCNMTVSLLCNGKRGSRYEPVKMCNLYTRT